ncbi:MAG: hypothetical protein L6V93_04835 [Clostridiales bacterium]|nr:MAG: hypothetical protein L6V93_04835 [Clostridiales bacterium]
MYDGIQVVTPSRSMPWSTIASIIGPISTRYFAPNFSFVSVILLVTIIVLSFSKRHFSSI